MNFSCSAKNSLRLLLLSVAFLAACQNIRTREDIKHQAPTPHPGAPSPAAPVFQPATPSTSYPTPPPYQAPVMDQSPSEPLPPSPLPPSDLPRIGVILSGGGAKTYAHIGFLQEMARLKIPVHAVAGIEFAAPMAALFANKGLANDVEWQMFKIKDEEVVRKSLLSSNKANDISSLNDFLRLSFARMKVEDMRLAFACPALNLAKNQVYLMSRGSVDALLPYCWPYPPLFKPFKNNVSAVRDVKMLADYLRSKGANYIIFVNAMGGSQKHSYIGEKESMENVVWSEIAGQYSRSQAGVDSTISLNTEDYGLADFDKRREIMQKGADSSDKSLRSLSEKMGSIK